jgi:hypothetical protein
MGGYVSIVQFMSIHFWLGNIRSVDVREYQVRSRYIRLGQVMSG